MSIKLSQLTQNPVKAEGDKADKYISGFFSNRLSNV